MAEAALVELARRGISVDAIALRRYYTLMPPNLRQVIRNLKEAHP